MRDDHTYCTLLSVVSKFVPFVLTRPLVTTWNGDDWATAACSLLVAVCCVFMVPNRLGNLQPINIQFPPKPFDIFSTEGGCSEGSGAFRHFFNTVILYYLESYNLGPIDRNTACSERFICASFIFRRLDLRKVRQAWIIDKPIGYIYPRRPSGLLVGNHVHLLYTTLCRYINYKWISINISYICHVEHHMTPAIDKRGIITYSYHKERTKKIKIKWIHRGWAATIPGFVLYRNISYIPIWYHVWYHTRRRISYIPIWYHVWYHTRRRRWTKRHDYTFIPGIINRGRKKRPRGMPSHRHQQSSLPGVCPASSDARL